MSRLNFAKLIKDYRNLKFLTQEEFAKEIGVSFVTVNRWENGKYEPTMKQKKHYTNYFLRTG